MFVRISYDYSSLKPILSQSDSCVLPYILVYKMHFSYSKIESVLYAGHTKRESNEYMNNKQIYQVCFLCCLSNPNKLWAEQYDKSDNDFEEEGDKMYDEMVTHEQMFSEESDDDEFWGF